MTDKNIRIFFRIHRGISNDLQMKIMLLRAYESEKNLLSQKDIAKRLNKPITTINYNISKLRKAGLLDKLNFLTDAGKGAIRKLGMVFKVGKKYRAHKLHGRFNLAAPFKDFDSYKNQYVRISKSAKYAGFRVEFNECIVFFWSETSITFYIPEVWGNSISEIHAEAYEQYIKPLQNYLQQMFKGLQISEYKQTSLEINHLAYVNHPLARLYKELGITYTSDRLMIDHSKGTPELETINQETAVQDMDRIEEYENSIRGLYIRMKSKLLKGG